VHPNLQHASLPLPETDYTQLVGKKKKHAFTFKGNADMAMCTQNSLRSYVGYHRETSCGLPKPR